MPEDTAPLRLNKRPTTRAEISRSAIAIRPRLADALEYRSSWRHLFKRPAQKVRRKPT